MNYLAGPPAFQAYPYNCYPVGMIVKINFFPEASRLFLCDVYRSNDSHPVVRTSEPDCRAVGGPPHLIIMSLKEEICHYGFQTVSSTTQFTGTVFDGTVGTFKVVFNTGLSSVLREDAPYRGCTLIPVDYKFIWLESDADGTKRAFIFINEFDWKRGPVVQKSLASADDVSEVSLESSIIYIDQAVIDKVEKTNSLVFTDCFQHDEGFFYYAVMNSVKVGRGIFISTYSERKEWLESNKVTVGAKCSAVAIASDLCDCQKPPYGMMHCMTSQQPLGQLNITDVFNQVSDRLQGDVAADSFDELEEHHKRWCMHWHCAVDFFKIHGGRKALPQCFIEAVRTQYPGPHDEYTGHQDGTGN